MKLSVGLKVANTLSLTPQLQQAIKLLQLSSLELEQEIQNQLDSNPLLEAIDDDFKETSSANDHDTDQSSHEEYNQNELIPDDLPVDTDWDEIYTHQPTALATPEYEEREDNRSGTESLSDHLLWQINLLHLSKIEQMIAYCIVDALDERGYLDCEIEEILTAAQHLLTQAGIEEELELAEVVVVLKYIQRLDPVGVSCRNLVECLSIQLETYHQNLQLKANAHALLAHADLLMANDINRLMKQTKLSLEQLKHAMTLLKSFDPAPGAQFQSKEQEYQTPDVILQKKNDRWHVFLNPDILPKLRVNPYYAGLIKRADQSDDNQYLKNQMLEAKNFIKSIDERHKTLLKVATCIVEHQRDFFEIGPEGMKPLVLRDVADEVELHESTVSRVTTNKYILTPRGLFELKYFFSSHVGTATGGECSSTAIRAMIKKLIAAENSKKPLSDNTIAKMLQEEGIDVARRTVAKYRESLNIPSSSDRKILI
ncbi:RNA polymerase factor sigma-54 [Acinetobacter qingfengensis]|uniref:RNA polymerase sigma-54 factor n=1 Tax=Acinetobacter qingfengensis TaxID=1262585 RepID=A0A1E7RCI4_9GAMM|nr:RNA polymerase factor sigma-54 [Acinetobacter qingfengensis]KAA8735080.1 RNA polymerase factor sigma-54 [Acinetobacter qingfengensis]OEY97003.1 RNA polymerase factor sigma-54 [Acinetobacter qingfengensis]